MCFVPPECQKLGCECSEAVFLMYWSHIKHNVICNVLLATVYGRDSPQMFLPGRIDDRYSSSVDETLEDGSWINGGTRS